jgi:hypothetical protein
LDNHKGKSFKAHQSWYHKLSQYVKINVALSEDYAFAFTNLLNEFKDVFALTYKDLKGIPLKLHSIVVNLIFQYH